MGWACDAERNYFRRYLLGDSYNQKNCIVTDCLYESLLTDVAESLHKDLYDYYLEDNDELYESIMRDIKQIIRKRIIEYAKN